MKQYWEGSITLQFVKMFRIMLFAFPRSAAGGSRSESTPDTLSMNIVLRVVGIRKKVKTVKGRGGWKSAAAAGYRRRHATQIHWTFLVLTDACLRPLSAVPTCLFVRITWRDKYTSLVLKKYRVSFCARIQFCSVSESVFPILF